MVGLFYCFGAVFCTCAAAVVATHAGHHPLLWVAVLADMSVAMLSLWMAIDGA